MIENERQYRITFDAVAKFERALAMIESDPELNSDIHPVLRKAQEDAIRSQLGDLRAELREYEARRLKADLPG
ncbi:MAG: hypothetical protein U0893_24470 [Chloroflexota bacterium]